MSVILPLDEFTKILTPLIGTHSNELFFRNCDNYDQVQAAIDRFAILPEFIHALICKEEEEMTSYIDSTMETIRTAGDSDVSHFIIEVSFPINPYKVGISRWVEMRTHMRARSHTKGRSTFSFLQSSYFLNLTIEDVFIKEYAENVERLLILNLI